jgi:hypothetical protein
MKRRLKIPYVPFGVVLDYSSLLLCAFREAASLPGGAREARAGRLLVAINPSPRSALRAAGSEFAKARGLSHKQRAAGRKGLRYGRDGDTPGFLRKGTDSSVPAIAAKLTSRRPRTEWFD